MQVSRLRASVARGRLAAGACLTRRSRYEDHEALFWQLLDGVGVQWHDSRNVQQQLRLPRHTLSHILQCHHNHMLKGFPALSMRQQARTLLPFAAVLGI